MKIRIKNWDNFQHYRDRNPPWIKLHRRLLDDREFFNLDGPCVKTLVLLWILAAETTDGQLPAIDDIAFRLRIDSKMLASQISKLNHWIIVDASNALAECLHDDSNLHTNATSETETETKRESDTESELRLSPPVAKTEKPKLPNAKEITLLYLSIFNDVFSRRTLSGSLLEPRIKSRIADGVPPWQILSVCIIAKAVDEKIDKLQGFDASLLLRDGKHARTTAYGTCGATNWIERTFLKIDTVYLDERLTAIAKKHEVFDDIKDKVKGYWNDEN